MAPHYEELPSGKKIFRLFDGEGRLRSEMHAYGQIDIAFTMEFVNGTKVSEQFIVKNRLVSREKYQKARENFVDMPAPDSSLEDFGGELLKAVGTERRQFRKQQAAYKPDPDKARQIDAFCMTMMDRGHRDAVPWIESSLNSLGEMTNSASRKLVTKLLQLGCARIYACEIDTYDDDRANTGHLVVELPSDADRRKVVFRKLARLANSDGLRGDFDDGQKYSYIKLD